MQQFQSEADTSIGWEIWDGVSPINGASPDVVRREHPGEARYLIKEVATGQVLILQADDPEIPGIQPMDEPTARLRAEAHADQVRNRFVEGRAAEVMRPWNGLRAARAELLTEVDHKIQAAEDTGADPAALRAYRQALRGVTTGLADPAAVMWPAKPWE